MRQTSTLRAVIAGAIGGLAGTWAMNQAQRAWTRAVDGTPPDSAGGKHDAREWQERTEHRNSNEIVAEAIGEQATGRPLTRAELAIGAPLVHFGFGMTVGAIYGACAGRVRMPAVAAGVAFGTAVWLAADEAAMPLLDLSDSPWERPAESHAQALAAHLVFGTVAELTRRALMPDRAI